MTNVSMKRGRGRNRKARNFLFSSGVKIGKKLTVLVLRFFFFLSLPFFRETLTLTGVKIETKKPTKKYVSFFRKLTNESYVTRRTAGSAEFNFISEYYSPTLCTLVVFLLSVY